MIYDCLYDRLKYFILLPDAPWCGPCAQLAEEWVKVAKIFKKEIPELKMGKIDGSVQEKLVQQMNIEGYPTILFIQYRGRRISTYSGKTCAACLDTNV